MSTKVLMVCTEDEGGIASYTRELEPYLSKAFGGSGFELEESTIGESYNRLEKLRGDLKNKKPDLVHFQHEYGIWGSKVLPFYSFPRVVGALRKEFPAIKFTATAHTVLNQGEPWPHGKGMFPKWFLNGVLAPVSRPWWNDKTWGQLDGVIVHSRHQVELIRKSGAGLVEEIPHFVLKPSDDQENHSILAQMENLKIIMVFGYFSEEKAQDVAVRAFSALGDQYALLLAGGVRRGADEEYFNFVQGLIAASPARDRIFVTQYVDARHIDSLYKNAEVVLAPFRRSWGSGSLAQGLARGAAILASDVIVNQEVNDRVPGCLELFKAENVQDLSVKLNALFENPERIISLRRNALAYAEKYSIEKMASSHKDFFQKVCQR